MTSVHKTSMVMCLAMAIGCGDGGGGSDDGADTSTGGESSGEPTTSGPTTSGPTSASTTADPSATASTTEDPSDTTDEPGDSSSDSADATTDGGTTETSTVPSVVETTPADGEIGVVANTSLVVRFSEPMDPDSVIAAYESLDLPADSVTAAWNDANDQVYFTLDAPLLYAEGNDPGEVAPLSYAFTIGEGATSAAGVPLDAPVTVTFSTLRRLHQSFSRDQAMSGAVSSDGMLPINTYVGDTNTDQIRRYAVTFDLAALVPGVVTLESATFAASWDSDSGDPWAALGGGTVISLVSYETLDADTFDTATLGDAVGVFAGINDVEVMRDVAEPMQAVLDDLDGYGNRAQFRMRWLIETDDDGAYDGVTLSPDMTLALTVLAP